MLAHYDDVSYSWICTHLYLPSDIAQLIRHFQYPPPAIFFETDDLYLCIYGSDRDVQHIVARGKLSNSWSISLINFSLMFAQNIMHKRLKITLMLRKGQGQGKRSKSKVKVKVKLLWLIALRYFLSVGKKPANKLLHIPLWLLKYTL